MSGAVKITRLDLSAAQLRNVWPAPLQDVLSSCHDQFASTYPASGLNPGQDGDTQRPGPHKTPGVERHFLNQVSRTPFDCQAISIPPLATSLAVSAL